jgi:cytochrome c peroxidase
MGRDRRSKGGALEDFMQRLAALVIAATLALACNDPQPVAKEISAIELQERGGSVVVLDVRTAAEFEAGHVPGAINISHDELAGRLDEVEAYREREVVVYCERGGRASKAQEVLAAQGFQKLAHLTGDMSGWREAGHPVQTPQDEAKNRLVTSASAIFGTLPEVAANPANPESDAKIALGRMLFYDTRLSKNHDVSCNSCHDLGNYGQDNQATSLGHRDQRGGRSSPTVYNAALHVAQFWDGREPDVEAQAKGPVLNPIEMAMPSAEAVVAVLESIPGYVEAFAAAFPAQEDPVTYDNLGLAIGAFERRLLTPSRVDDFIAGNLGALSDAEAEGLQTFLETGCITCHSGPAVGGQLYRKLGLIKPYETEDAGRYDVTGNETDRGVFKVPSLRNITHTAPYFHDGSIATLDEAIRVMADHQLGKTLTDDQVASIKLFLESLTGRVDQAYTKMPTLPESGPDTPAPDPS